MKLLDDFVRWGDLCFRRRSYLPLLLVPLFAASFIGASYPFKSHGLGLLWEIGCFLLSMAGLALRVFTVGTAPRGTSGRNSREQKATVLNTTGAYSLVRHPLYLGNFLIILGMSLFSRTWFLPIIVSLAATLYYERIAAREEEYLEDRFGEEFRTWAARVPAVTPHFKNFRPSSLPFSWRKALRQEFYGMTVITTGFFVLDMIEDVAVTRKVILDSVWTGVFAAGALLFGTLWVLKKKGLLKPPEDHSLEERLPAAGR